MANQTSNLPLPVTKVCSQPTLQIHLNAGAFISEQGLHLDCNTGDVNKAISLFWAVMFTSQHIHFTTSVSTWWNLYMRSATFIH